MSVTRRLLPSVLVLACVAWLPFVPPAAAPAPAEAELSAFSWMVGRWVAEHDDMFMEETWLPVQGDALIGTFRLVRGGNTLFYELEAIEQTDDGPVFRLRHFDRGLVPWAIEAEGALSFPLLSVEDGRAVFEDPAGDDVRRVIYEREADVLTVILEKADPQAHPERFAFTLAE